MVGADMIVIRMAHAGNWQEVILKNVPGATLETFEGQTYVQSAPIPALGPVGSKFRFPDNKTIVAEPRHQQRGNVSNQGFFDNKPAPPPRAWPTPGTPLMAAWSRSFSTTAKLGGRIFPKTNKIGRNSRRRCLKK